MTVANDLAVRRALEAAGVELIDKDCGGPGVRLRGRTPNSRTFYIEEIMRLGVT